MFYRKLNNKVMIGLTFCLLGLVLLTVSLINNSVLSKEDSIEEFMEIERNVFYDNKIDSNLDFIKKNEVIIIGDSRFEQIVDNYNEYKIPQNFTFIAKSAMEVNWFKNTALNSLNKILNKKSNDKIYHVVINMGVNDIQKYRPFDSSIKTYLKEYSKLINQYDDVHFYLLSINPIVEKKLKVTQPDNVRTNKDIDYFNEKLMEFSNNNNISYCPANEAFDFNTDDGIHYTEETNQVIIDYIANDCVKY